MAAIGCIGPAFKRACAQLAKAGAKCKAFALLQAVDISNRLGVIAAVLRAAKDTFPMLLSATQVRRVIPVLSTLPMTRLVTSPVCEPTIPLVFPA
jgi:hypothetical protein